MKLLGTLVAIVSAAILVWNLASAWQRHVADTEAICEQVAALVHIAYSEHPEYVLTINPKGRCQ